MFIGIILFVIIYCAVRLAINPLLHNQEEIVEDNQDSELVKLRDMDILNNDELEEVIKLYQSNNNNNNKNDNNEELQQYEKYTEILNDLKNRGYLNEGQYNERIEKLKNYFKNY